MGRKPGFVWVICWAVARKGIGGAGGEAAGRWGESAGAGGEQVGRVVGSWAGAGGGTLSV